MPAEPKSALRFFVDLDRAVVAPGFAGGSSPPRGRRALVYGSVPSDVERHLIASGMLLDRTADALDAVRMLRAASHHSVIVDPAASQALDLIRTLKSGVVELAGLGPGAGQELGQALARVPLFVLPEDRGPEYAVLVQPPWSAFLVQESEVPFATAVLRLDVDAVIAAYPAPGPVA